MQQYLLLLLYVNILQGLELCSNTLENTKQICAKSEGYDKFANPTFPKPTEALIEIVLRSVLNVDEDKQLLEIIAYSNIRWLDTRLDLKSDLSRIKYSKEDVIDLWKPSIHFSNVVTNTNRISNRFYSYKNTSGGLWIERILLNKAVISCTMDFSDYPFDSHVCAWKIRSNESKDVTNLKIVSIQQETRNESATETEPIPLETTNLPYDIYVSPGGTGTEFVQREQRSFVLVKFSFARNKNGRLKLISAFFLPTCLFALLSLVSFLIKPEIVPGRMGMLVIIFLILITIHGNVEGPA